MGSAAYVRAWRAAHPEAAKRHSRTNHQRRKGRPESEGGYSPEPEKARYQARNSESMLAADHAHRRWTPEEESHLRDGTAAEVARLLGRSNSSIAQRRHVVAHRDDAPRQTTERMNHVPD